MNLYKVLVSAMFSVIITYMLTIMYIGNKVIFKVLDKNVVYSPLLQSTQILPGFGFYYENNSSVPPPPYYHNISIPMKISFLLLSL
jgi:hypothetical protein